MKAIWKDTVLAQSDDTVIVEDNHYFPITSLNTGLFTPSDYTTYCPWKGEACYYSVTVAGETNVNAAWYYPEPYAAAAMIRDRVAFWNGVEVVE